MATVLNFPRKIERKLLNLESCISHKLIWKKSYMVKV